METENFQEIVNAYVEAFEKSDVSIIDKLFADDATLEDPVGSDVKIGKVAILEFYNSAFSLGAKLQLHPPIRVAGNSVAFAFSVLIGDMKISPIDVFEINASGKIQCMRAYWGPENIA